MAREHPRHHPAKPFFRHVYDAGDRLDSVKDAAQDEIPFAYDLDGNRLVQTDANHNTTSYTYDARHHRRSLTYPAITHGAAASANAASARWD
jgi:YD repeat-containing protein